MIGLMTTLAIGALAGTCSDYSRAACTRAMEIRWDLTAAHTVIDRRDREQGLDDAGGRIK